MRERRWRCCWIYRKLILAVALDQRLPALACHESIIEERKSKGPDVYHLEQVKSMQNARDIAGVKVLTTVNEVENTGSQQYTAYVKERVVEPTKLITDVIKQNRLPLFRNPKKNCSLTQLYNSCQVLQGNLDDFFSHENLSYPPSMSCFGNWRSGQKSDLVKIPVKLPASPIEATLVVGALLVDGAAFVNTLKPDQCVKM
ncbi:hypothetical protein OS493_022464 [Desmophyllum pertusum]|uniref:Uncharacterized protein n=1 Tax=Desmophyllum pertusum TaxID=174260 RepID=A0A9W9ZMP2_9CNID|nr:hypothetical protein OS493_022464 [Desmophyllum pertusum]